MTGLDISSAKVQSGGRLLISCGLGQVRTYVDFMGFMGSYEVRIFWDVGYACPQSVETPRMGNLVGKCSWCNKCNRWGLSTMGTGISLAPCSRV